MKDDVRVVKSYEVYKVACGKWFSAVVTGDGMTLQARCYRNLDHTAQRQT